MSEETLFDTAAFTAEVATKSARKRTAGKPAAPAAAATMEEPKAPAKLKRGPRTIAEALRANEAGAAKAKRGKKAGMAEAEAAPAAPTPPAPETPAPAPVRVVESTPAPTKGRRPARKVSAGEAPAAVEAPTRAPVPPAAPEAAPVRPVEGIHASLAAAAQSARQTPPPAPVEPVVADLPVVAAVPGRPERQGQTAPAAQQTDAVNGGAATAPSPHQEGQQPRERFSRRQRWKERRAREREQRSQKGGQPGQGGGAQGEGGQPGQHQQRHPESRNNNGGQERDREPEKLQGPPEAAEGILELSPKGHGFLRVREKLFSQLPQDVFVHGDMIRKFALREGMCVKGEARRNSRGLQMTEVATINGRLPEEIKDLPLFEELKATNPAKRYQLETRQDRMTTRVIDMMTPVGRGQRGLIVAPPRAGKTTLLQHIAEAMTASYPNVHLMILLVDERPEEVTEFRRVLPNAEIFASSNDSDVKSHTRIAQFAIERAKRLVEMGDHVFMLMDSITRLARAFNNANKGGATMSGGMGVGSMEIPRRLFAAARNTKTAGSLTILATALIETGSKMDDLIFAEFKGTGNMELVLDRKIAEQFIYPAVNIFKSGTRREELLLPAFQIEKIHMLRRGLAGHKPIEAVQRVLSLLERYPNNAQMLLELPSK